MANELTTINKRFGDSLQNLTANLAVGTAKTVEDAFGLVPITLTEIDAMYRGDWMSRKIIDMPVKDAIRPWRNWQTGKADVDKIKAAEKAHGVKKKLSQAFRWARLHGGAAILISNGDEQSDEPMKEVGKGKLQCLTVLSRKEIEPLGVVQDPRSPEFREPEFYQLATNDGGHLHVHHSRVIRLIGMERPDAWINEDGWGDSVLQIVYDAVHHAALTTTAIAELIHEAKVDVISVDGLEKHLATTKGTDLLTRRFSTAATMKSINNTLLLSTNDKWDRKQTSFAGLPEVLQIYLQIVAGAADVPATRLLGVSPTGMNATGEGDLRNYHEMLEGWRTDELAPILDRIDRVLWQDATGSSELDAEYVFGDLKEMTEKEQADIADKKADTTGKYFNMGILADEELREVVVAQLKEDAVYPGLEDAIREIRPSEDDPDAEDDETQDRPARTDRADDSYIPRYLSRA